MFAKLKEGDTIRLVGEPVKLFRHFVGKGVGPKGCTMVGHFKCSICEGLKEHEKLIKEHEKLI